jgi:DNA-binding LacI/PurR family transcriptional regulator
MPEKRELVLQAIKELNYRPNPVARSLKANRTNQLLFYVRDISNNYYIDMYRGMLEAASAAGYNVIVSANVDPDQISRLMVDGVVFPFDDPSSLIELRQIGVPMVSAGYNPRRVELEAHIDVDLASAVAIALEHLSDLGHRDIGFVAMEQEAEESRLLAFQRQRSALPSARSPVFGPAAPRTAAGQPRAEINYFEVGALAARQYLAAASRPTALLCFNDDTAIGLMSRLQAEGVRIPLDLSVVGVDDHSVSAYTSPPLTTVSISPISHGRECALRLIGLIEGRDEVRSGRIPCHLVVRGSTAEPRTAP